MSALAADEHVRRAAAKFWAWGVSTLGVAMIWGEVPPFAPLDRVSSWIMSLGFLCTAAGPSILFYLRSRAADHRLDREARMERHDLNNRLQAATGRIEMMEAMARLQVENGQRLERLLAEKERMIAELQLEVAENRAYQNEMRSHIRPQLPPLPPGPVEQRLSESGHYPPAMETSD